MIITHRCKDFKRVWVYTDTVGNAVDLSDASAEFAILDRLDCAVVLANYTNATNHITFDALNGIITLTVPAVEFTLPAGEYRYFLRLSLPIDAAVDSYKLLENSIMQVLYLPEVL